MGAAEVVSGVSQGLSSVPYVGGILSMLGTTIGGALQQSAAQKQAAQAEKIRKEALAAKTQALRPEFLAKKRMDNMAYLSGLPGADLAKENIDEQAATNLRAIRENSPNGATAVNAISSAIQLGNQASRDLDIKDATYKAGKLSDVGNTEWAIGEKQRQLEDIRDQTKREGLTAASAFDNAATANKMNAANLITGAITSTATNIGKTAQQQAYMKLLGDIYGSGANQTGATANSDVTSDAVENGGGQSIMTNTQSQSFDPDSQQKLASLLSSSQPLADDDLSFLTNMYNGLAVSGKQEDAALAKQIQQLLQANR